MSTMPGEQIRRDDILRAFPAAARSKDVLEAAVLDAAFDVLLREMHTQGLFEEFSVVFKGGTALRKLRFGHKGRFSFDLDFDVEPGSEEIIAEEVDGFASAGFFFEVAERRGHRHLRIASGLLPDGAYDVKLDFSHRGHWLGPDHLRPVASPALPTAIWDLQAAVPTMKLEENIAEKLSRWQTRRLVRDLHDIAAAWRLIDDTELVAELYVLKSHRNWSAMLPSRRPPQAAMPLAETTAATKPSHFALDDLVHPTIHTRAEKLHKIQADLEIAATATSTIDRHIADSPLQELALDTGRLAWKATQRIEALQDAHNIQTADPLALGPLSSDLESRLPDPTTRQAPGLDL
ncbi:MAG: nucleotidyl transferase AbiEii/AbiGii toxin family protein [bacterium]|nr:nucleotidyl transferase AbiEii/AbiGii toxin family protein [bacterium]